MSRAAEGHDSADHGAAVFATGQVPLQREGGRHWFRLKMADRNGKSDQSVGSGGLGIKGEG